jgi:hypothetical protein
VSITLVSLNVDLNIVRELRRSIADVFRIQVVSNSDVRSPIITLGSTSFFHVRVNNLYVVAVTKYDAFGVEITVDLLSDIYSFKLEITRMPHSFSNSATASSQLRNRTLERSTKNRSRTILF